MNVWVMTHRDPDGETVLGVFATLETAQALDRIERHDIEYVMEGDWCETSDMCNPSYWWRELADGYGDMMLYPFEVAS